MLLSLIILVSARKLLCWGLIIKRKIRTRYWVRLVIIFLIQSFSFSCITLTETDGKKKNNNIITDLLVYLYIYLSILVLCLSLKNNNNNINLFEWLRVKFRRYERLIISQNSIHNSRSEEPNLLWLFFLIWRLSP